MTGDVSKELMHIRFREAVLDKMAAYAFEHPELQQDAEALVQWARETYGVPIEGHDPMMTLAHRIVRLIAEYHQQHAERIRSRQRKAVPSVALPLLPAWMVREQTSADCTEGEADENEAKGVHTTALLGMYASGRHSYLCHQDCLSLLDYADCHEIRLIDREGYAPCEGCGFPLVGPSPQEWGLHPPLLVPADFIGAFYRVQNSVARETPRQPDRQEKRGKGAPQQLSLFEDV